MGAVPFDVYDFFGYIAAGVVVLLAAQIGLGFPKLLGTTLSAFDTAAAILATYVAGQIVAGPANFILENLFARRTLGSPILILMGRKRHRLLRFLFPGYFTPLSKEMIEKIETKIAPITVASDGEQAFAHIRYSHSVLNDQVLLARMSTFQYKYGFCRNVAFSLLCTSAAFALADRFASQKIPHQYALAALVAGVLLVYRYLFFYRLYTLELLSQYANEQ